MKAFHSTLFVILAVLASSCGCRHREQARVGFTQEQKQLFPPYKKNVAYSFIDRNGQTVDFKATIEKDDRNYLMIKR